MRCIILAAGRGSRLGPLTASRPKCLLAFNGTTLLERSISALRDGGISEIGIVAGYRSECLRPFADRLFRNALWESTGIVASLACAREWLEAGTCLVSYGDIFYGHRLVRRLVEADAPIAIGYDPHAVALWRSRSDDPLQDLETFDISTTGQMRKIGGRPQSLAEISGQYMGLLRLAPGGWQALERARDTLPKERRDTVDMTSVLARLIDAGISIYGVPSEEPWGEVDTPADLELYERLYPHV